MRDTVWLGSWNLLIFKQVSFDLTISESLMIIVVLFWQRVCSIIVMIIVRHASCSIKLNWFHKQISGIIINRQNLWFQHLVWYQSRRSNLGESSLVSRTCNTMLWLFNLQSVNETFLDLRSMDQDRSVSKRLKLRYLNLIRRSVFYGSDLLFNLLHYIRWRVLFLRLNLFKCY